MFDSSEKKQYTECVIEQRVYLRRNAPGASAPEGTRMQIPDYPSNREADKRTIYHCRRAGRCLSRMKPSRETCLHMKDMLLGWG